jgi:hypothetical protein
VKQPSQKSQDRTQEESVRIEDSSGQQSSEKRGGLVGRIVSKEDIAARSVISGEWYNCYMRYNCR